MNIKQFLFDVVVVGVIPLILLVGYFSFKKSDTTLLSFVLPSSTSLPGQASQELGAKTKTALMTLKSIQLNDTLFTDPAYLALHEYPVTIATTTLGRTNPFVPPPAITDILRRAKGTGAVASPLTPATPISVKLDTIKKGATK